MISASRFIVVSFLLFTISCSCSKKQASVNKSDPTPVALEKTAVVDSTSAVDRYRFIVSFISIGAGTDFKAHQSYQNYISIYNKDRKDALIVEKTSWGREGEVDYCHKLNELSSEEQSKFISDIKVLLKESTLVRYKENASCRKSRKE